MDANTILEALKSYGYVTPEGADDTTLVFMLISDVNQYIKHYCNVNEVPECLEHVVISMVCGKFLQLKKVTGQLTQIQLDGVLKSVRDGDTTVEYNVSYLADPEATFTAFVDKMINGHESELISHRRLTW